MLKPQVSPFPPVPIKQQITSPVRATPPLGTVLSEPFRRPPAILSSCGTRRRTNISHHVIGDSCPGTLFVASLLTT
eukprot:scaffold1986_cov40-Attheya_sp.AAC.2